MFRKKNKRAGTVPAGRRAASMLDVIALAASLIFILAACAAAAPEGGSASAESPVIIGSPPVTADAPADTTSTAGMSPEAPYPEYTLTNRYDSAALHPGVQEGLYPWELTLDTWNKTSHTSGDMPGAVFYRADGEQFRLFYQHLQKRQPGIHTASFPIGPDAD